MIDTVDLSGSTDKNEDEPGYFDPLPSYPKAKASAQWTWIEDQLKASKADFILVAGHYPVYSVCSHGPTPTLVDNLRPLLMQYGGNFCLFIFHIQRFYQPVSFKAHYASGHDHCLLHMKEPSTYSYSLQSSFKSLTQ